MGCGSCARIGCQHSGTHHRGERCRRCALWFGSTRRSRADGRTVVALWSAEVDGKIERTLRHKRTKVCLHAAVESRFSSLGRQCGLARSRNLCKWWRPQHWKLFAQQHWRARNEWFDDLRLAQSSMGTTRILQSVLHRDWRSL